MSIAVHAMRCGAVQFLEKPVRENDLWNAIQEALQLDEQRRQARLLQLEVDNWLEGSPKRSRRFWR